MLIKNFIDSPSANTNTRVNSGTVVGVNIKKCHMSKDTDVETYGLFLHVSVDINGVKAQYDIVFDLFTNDVFHPSVLTKNIDMFSKSRLVKKPAVMTWKQLKKLWNKAKAYKKKLDVGEYSPFRYSLRESSPIVELLDVCAVNEWVEIIGSTVNLETIIPVNPDDISPIFMEVHSINDLSNLIHTHMIIPNLFQIHTDDADLNSYMEAYRAYNPTLCVDEYDRSKYHK